ncbi:acyltransferase family protein [Shewanella xiamenensis]|uniref:acyltransferase family protein n=1 Tax=Shewanella xiamenensis TaxID=332186 RepID=UPI0035BB3F0B
MTYRADIQVLRGIAVLLVLFYHLNIELFQFGYLGVDIFLVISGYLMASLYRGGYVKFIYKRLSRLLPAYFATTIFFTSLALLLLKAGEWEQTKNSAISSFFFVSNISKAFSSSYFSTEFYDIFLHHWSLGLEIQFYLIFPFLFLFFKERRFLFIYIILLLIPAAFFVTYKYNNFGFYLLPFRLWEFFIGMLAFYFRKNSIFKFSSNTFLILTVFLIFFILLNPIYLINKSINFHPGLSALIVCTLTAMILYIETDNSNLQGKGYSVLRVTGDYSYSLYLVHYPIILFFTYVPLSGLTISYSVWEFLLIVCCILLATWVIYSFFERKVDFKAVSFLAFFTLFSLITSSTFNTDRNNAVYYSVTDRDTFRCGKFYALFNPNQELCYLNDIQFDQKVLLLGNSHADSIKKQFSNIAESYGFGTYFMVRNNPLMKNGLSADRIVEEVSSKGIGLIVVHFSPGVIDIPEFEKFLTSTESMGITVVFIESVPVYNFSIPKTLEALSPLEDISNYRLKPLEFDSKNLVNLLDRYNIFTLSPSKILCNSAGCLVTDEKGELLYFDTDHLTLTGASFIGQILNSAFIR